MDPRALSIQDFTYDLPEDRIAQRPLAERDASKLLVHQNGISTDRSFRDLPALLPPDALLVLNDTKVVHARIGFRRTTGAELECMVLSPEHDRPMESALQDRSVSRWWCFMGNAKRWKGEELVLQKAGRTISAIRIDMVEGEHLIEFRWDDGGAFVDRLAHFGAVPLPPYMRREAVPEDDTRYNTVFSKQDGSVAAPTASLHFSGLVMSELAARGIRTTTLTLHVGAGTFLPVKTATMAQHAMHMEQVRLPLHTLHRLAAQLSKGPIIPVGTTALRTLESLYWHGVMVLQGRAGSDLDIDQWEPYAHDGKSLPSAQEALQAVIEQVEQERGELLMGCTKLLIAPGYDFRFADALVTNFHQPQSTLLLLVAAFVGPQWRTIYAHALANEYRFLSYGDGSLLFRSR